MHDVPMQPWQVEALEALLATETTEVEANSRVYTSSKTYGDSRFHLISKRYDGIQIEQTNIDDKWGSRVQLQSDEIPATLKTLLTWYLETKNPAQHPEDLGDLDDHPF